MDSKNVYRKANGRKVEGAGLGIRIAQELNGKLLSHAFVVARSAGFKLRVNKLDDVVCWRTAQRNDDEVVNVDVIDGTVRKSWVDQRLR